MEGGGNSRCYLGGLLGFNLVDGVSSQGGLLRTASQESSGYNYQRKSGGLRARLGRQTTLYLAELVRTGMGD